MQRWNGPGHSFPLHRGLSGNDIARCYKLYTSPHCLTEVGLGALLSRLPEGVLYKTAVIRILKQLCFNLFSHSVAN